MAPKKLSVLLTDPQIGKQIRVEPQITLDSVDEDTGIIGKAIKEDNLQTFLSLTNKEIYPISIIEFFGNNSEATQSTTLSYNHDNLTPENRVYESFKLSMFTDALELRSSSKAVGSAGSDNINDTLRRFSDDAALKFAKGKITNVLRSLYKKMCDLVTKIILSHNGTHSTITRMKLKEMCALMDEINGVRHNRAAFIINHWIGTGKNVQYQGILNFIMSSHVRYGRAISGALGKLFVKIPHPFYDERFAFAHKKVPLLKVGDDASISLL